MSKLRLIDTFGKSFFIINYIFCTDESYSLSNIEILEFILSEFLKKVKKTIDNLLKKIYGY